MDVLSLRMMEEELKRRNEKEKKQKEREKKVFLKKQNGARVSQYVSHLITFLLLPLVCTCKYLLNKLKEDKQNITESKSHHRCQFHQEDSLSFA